jgi:hypothetical protein
VRADELAKRVELVSEIVQEGAKKLIQRGFGPFEEDFILNVGNCEIAQRNRADPA